MTPARPADLANPSGKNTALAHPQRHASAEFIGTRELCRRLSISKRTVFNHGLTRYGFRVGTQWRFDWSAVLGHYARDGTPGQREERAWAERERLMAEKKR